MEILALVLIVISFIYLNSKVNKVEEQNKKIVSLLNKVINKEKVNTAQISSQKEEKTTVSEGAKYIIKNSENTASTKQVSGKKNENFFAEKVLPILGVVTVLFGVSFFLAYAFENNLIDEPTRIILGFVSGLVFIGLGKTLLQKIGNYAVFLIGAGISILYLTAKFGLEYNLYDNIFAFIVMIVITALAYFVSYFVNSKTLAFISTIGGFLTPLLVSTGQSNYFVLFTYITILLTGILFVTYKKNWKEILISSFVFTAFWFVASVAKETGYSNETGEYGNIKFYAEIFLAFLVIYFLYFTIVPFVFHFSKKGKNSTVENANLIIPVFAGLGLFVFSFELLNQISKSAEVVKSLYFTIPLLATFVYLGLTKKTLSLITEKKPTYFFLTMSVISIGLIPVFQFTNEHNIIIISWFGILLVLAFLYNKTREEIFVNTAFLPTVAGSLGLWSIIPTYYKNLYPFANADFLTVVVGAGSLIISYYLIKPVDNKKARIFSILGHLIILFGITFEVYRYAEFAKSQFLVTLLPVFYIVYSFVMLYLGVLRKDYIYKNFALIIFGYTIGKLYLVDIWEFEPLFRIIAFLILGILMLVASYYYYKKKEEIKEFLS